MPFTGAHPLAVLPFLRTSLPPSALVVGSVVPDLPLFVPFRVPFDAVVRGHTPLGLLTIDLPLGLLLWVLWHALLAPAGYGAAPPALRARLTGDHRPGLRRRWRGFWRVPVAIVLGAVTHVVWDEFTHAGRWGERHVPALAAGYGPLPGWHWAQYLSGVLGLALLALWLWRWWTRTEPAAGDAPDAAAWPWLVIVLATVGTAVGAALAAGPPLREAAYAAAVHGVAVGTLAGVVLALAWHLRRSPPQR